MITDKNRQATLKLAYEFMYDEFQREKRRTTHRDPERLQWLKTHIIRLQSMMYELLPPDVGLNFTSL